MTPDPSAAVAPARRTVPLRVLVVDDQPVVRQGLMSLLRGTAAAPREVRSVSGLHDAREALAAWGPHVVVLDVDLAGDDGLSLLPGAADGAQVLVLSSHGDVATRARAARLGAHAFVDKAAPATELLGLVDRVSAARAALESGWEEAPAPPGRSRPPGMV